jgi:DNA-directed RNA polymerase subunit beta
MPWEGYNFEDTLLISERLVYEDIYTFFHIRKYEIQMDTTTQGSADKITKQIPHLEHLLHNLGRNGFESLCEELQKKFFQQKCELGRVGR